MIRHLFFGEECAREVHNMRFRQHTPVKHPENPLIVREYPWEDMYMSYPNVLFDPDTGVFRMWYYVRPGRERQGRAKYLEVNKCSNNANLAYAESRDGINWEKPELGLVEYEGSTANNLVPIGSGFIEGCCVYYDHAEQDPAKRYKALWDNQQDIFLTNGPQPDDGVWVAYSSDGLNWTNVPTNPVCRCYSDTGNQLVRDPRTGEFFAYGRFGFGRRIAFAQSEDFEHWTDPELVLEGDDVDGDYVQHYGMSVWPYESHFIGLLWVFRARGNDPRSFGNDNRIEVQLAYSSDGKRWHRFPGRGNVIPNGSDGAWDGAIIHAAAQPIIRDDTIYAYYDGMSWLHTGGKLIVRGYDSNTGRAVDTQELCGQDMTQPAGIGLATFRRDGFVSLEADQFGGYIITQPMEYSGGALHINARTSGGYVRAVPCDPDTLVPIEGVDYSEPFHGDSTNAELVLNPTQTAGLIGKRISLRIECLNSNIYSYWLENR